MKLGAPRATSAVPVGSGTLKNGHFGLRDVIEIPAFGGIRAFFGLTAGSGTHFGLPRPDARMAPLAPFGRYLAPFWAQRVPAGGPKSPFST